MVHGGCYEYNAEYAVYTVLTEAESQKANT